ncbi:MAG: GerMN domain-containing protein [Bacillota bacterium]
MKQRALATGMLVILVLVLLAGCTDPQQAPGRNDADINPRPAGQEITLTLYFPIVGGAWMEMEQRAVVQKGEPLESLILKELLRGPKLSGHQSYLPASIMAGVEVREHTAYVSLSRDAENMPYEQTRIQLQAMVNSLTEVEGIDNVQFLVDGKQQMSLNIIYIGEPWDRTLNRVARPGFRPIADCDPRRGEMFIEGEVKAVKVEENAIVIDQHLQDARSVKVNPTVQLRSDVIIHLQGPGHEATEITLPEVKKGDVVGIILTSEGTARAVIVARRERF